MGVLDCCFVMFCLLICLELGIFFLFGLYPFGGFICFIICFFFNLSVWESWPLLSNQCSQ